HAMVTRDGAELIESFDPKLAVAALGMAECKHLADAPGRCLPDPGFENVQGALSLGVDSGEHQERLEAQIPTSWTQLGRTARGSVRRNDRYGLATVFDMRRAEGHVLIAGRLDSAKGSFERKPSIGQRHARDLKAGRRAVADLIVRYRRRFQGSLCPERAS